MKRSFFQAAVASILLYGCTTWTLTKRLEKKLDGNYSRMLRAILNKSWQQHPTRHQLPPITKTIQVRRTRHAENCWRSRDELISDVLLWTPTYGQKQDDQHEHTFSNYVRIRDVVQKTCQRRWTIGKSGERGSGISVLPARHDDDDIYIIWWRIGVVFVFYIVKDRNTDESSLWSLSYHIIPKIISMLGRVIPLQGISLSNGGGCLTTPIFSPSNMWQVTFTGLHGTRNKDQSLTWLILYIL